MTNNNPNNGVNGNYIVYREDKSIVGNAGSWKEAYNMLPAFGIITLTTADAVYTWDWSDKTMLSPQYSMEAIMPNNPNPTEDTMTQTTSASNLRPFFVNIDSPEKDGLFNDPLAFAQRVLEYPDMPAVLAVGYAGGTGNTYPGVADVPVPTRDIVADLTTFHLRRKNGGPMWFARHADGTWLKLHDLRPNPYRNNEGLACVKSCYVVIYYNGNEDTPASVLERNRRMWWELDLPCDEFQTGHCSVEELTDDAGDFRRVVVW